MSVENPLEDDGIEVELPKDYRGLGEEDRKRYEEEIAGAKTVKELDAVEKKWGFEHDPSQVLIGDSPYAIKGHELARAEIERIRKEKK